VIYIVQITLTMVW